jgi:galactonate dehydratase
MEIPTRNGIGIELVENVAEKYPYHIRPVKTRLSIDGSVVDQ